jgi:hypothetical protein
VALTLIRWVPGFEFDRHVFRQFPDWPGLDGFLQAFDDDPTVGTQGQYVLSARPAASDITSVRFTPRFAGAPSNHGVDVSTSTGAITLDPPPSPSPALGNFLLEIEVEHTSPNLPTPVRNGVRIHVHDALSAIRLTPDPLVGRQGALNVRFTVLARFGDGIVGEVTDWTLLQAGAHHVVELSSSGAAITVDPDDQTIGFVTQGGSAAIGVAFMGTPTGASAQAQCGPPWSTPTEAVFVDGRGEGARDDVPNVLFLPDGFDAGERAGFEGLVKDLVQNGLARNAFLSPYVHLSRSMNFWSCFVPSPKKGTSILSEVGRLHGPPAARRALPIENPSKPSPAATRWTLEELVHEVGLPLPAHRNRSRAALLTEWQALFGAHVTQPRVSGPVPTPGGGIVEAWSLWRQLSDRTLVPEVSTAFGMAVGGRRSADCVGTVARQLAPDPKRLDVEDFDEFLRNVQFRDRATGTLTPLGARWGFVQDPPGTPNARTAGKDLGLVCIVARTPLAAGTNVGFAYASSLGEEQEHRLTSPSPGDLAVVAQAVPKKASLSLVLTVAHETAHSFSCDDEYAGDCSHGRPRGTSDRANTQLEDENGLVTPGPQVAIDGTRIKWLWPRIEKAGVLRDRPTQPDPVAQPHRFAIALRPGHTPFAVDDEVRLRGRPLVQNRVASFLLKITGVHADPLLGDTLDAEQIEGLPLVIIPAGFPGGSVLLKPLRQAGADVLLVNPDVVQHVTSSDGPLNASAADPARSCPTAFGADPAPHLFNVQFATNLPASLKPGTRQRPTWGSWIVGIYEGGAGFPCGIFHPTGACLMRSGWVPRRTLSGKPIVAGLDTQGRRTPPPGTLYKFCPVCRYTLVDAIDPTKHPNIEREYAPIFPA